MKLSIFPGQPLRGEVSLPGDKSISHRAALLAALADGESRIDNFLVSGVTQSMLDALSALGVTWELDGNRLTVQGRSTGGLLLPGMPINCGNSGTTMRLLVGALSAAGVPAVLDGSEGLRRRPMLRIVDPLRQMGVAIQSEGGYAPLELRMSSMPLRGIDYDLPVASAQVKSCLLLAALAAEEDTCLREPGPSRDHTERMLRNLGVDVSSEYVPARAGQPESYITHLQPPAALHLPAFQTSLPGDTSAAAFLIVAAVITPGSEISLRQVGLNPTRSGVIEALRSMGADIHVSAVGEQGGEPVGDLTVRSSELHGRQISGSLVVRMIDEFPIFAVAAAYARGRTEICEAGELRHKESDRIAALCTELRAIGVEADETADGFIIQGSGRVQGGRADPHGDHRLAMSLAAAGLASQRPIVLQGAEIMQESFPGYIETLEKLGAELGQDEEPASHL